MQTHSGTK